ncbi:MAG: DUF2946 family protein [Pseudomonadota bacterium]|jgi:hypothetical protein
MGWLRANARLTGMVALLALALQFASSFGHFHREWIGQPEVAHIEPAGAADRDHDHHSHHDGQPAQGCSICIAASFAHGIVPSSPPVLPALTAYTASGLALLSELPASPQHRRPFQSRAPPLA